VAVSSVENSTDAETMPNGSETDAPKVVVRDTECSLVIVTSEVLSQIYPETWVLILPKEGGVSIVPICLQ
jgi:hypothetical protein